MESTIKTVARIDATTVKAFETEMGNAVSAGSKSIIVDMDDTIYICSSALRVFLTTQKKMRASGGTMVLKNVKQQILEIFEVTGFAGVLTIE